MEIFKNVLVAIYLEITMNEDCGFQTSKYASIKPSTQK